MRAPTRATRQKGGAARRSRAGLLELSGRVGLSGALLFSAGAGCGPEAASPARASQTGVPQAGANEGARAARPEADASSPREQDASPSDPAAPAQDSARTVLVVSIDGLRHDYLDDAARAPTLRRLRDEGAAARTLRSVWPTMTYPAHTTLVTGARPARHGISNNVVFDPYDRNEHGWYWYASDIRAPTLWDAAAKHGLTVGNVYWPVTVGADIPFTIPQLWRAKNDEDDKLLSALSTRGAMEGLRAPPAEHRSDRERTDAALKLLRERHPRLMFVYLTDLDTTQHEHGPMSPDAFRTLRAIDGYVGELVVAAASRGAPLTLALVSDHGFSEVTHEVRPNVALRAKGWLTVNAQKKLAGYKLFTWKAGGTAAIVAADPKDEATKRAAREHFTKLAADPRNGIARVLANEETEGAFANKGAAFVLEARRGFVFGDSWDAPMVTRAKYYGAHGYGPDAPEMGATLFFWGDGVRRAELGDVDMIDVAPTIASLLSFTLAEAEGKPLAAALR